MLLSAQDIHERLNGHLSLWTIRQYMSSGVIVSRKYGRKWLCTLDAFHDWQDSLESSAGRNSVHELPKRHEITVLDFRNTSPRKLFQSK